MSHPATGGHAGLPLPGGGPLEGLRVIELATVIMGPYAGQQFGDLGADVIKIEGPAGDSTRQFEPKRHSGMGGPTLNLNRNKRSITLDLKDSTDRDSLLALLETADVFITNVRPGALERLSLGWDDVAAVNPQLVYATAQGFRSNSTMRDNAAYDDIIQAASGLVWLNEHVTGEPHFIPSVIADKVCGLMMVQSVLAALHYRDRTGHGQHVEVPMADTMIAFNLVEHLAAASLLPADETDYGYRRVLSRERKASRTADGWMCILPYNDANWKDFFRFAGDPEAAADLRFTTMAGRVKNADALYARMRSLTAQFSTAEWQRMCDSASIPAHPVYSLSESAHSDYALDGDLVVAADHPTEGPYQLIGHPVRYSRTPAHVRRHCPTQGQHTESILDELGRGANPGVTL